MPTGGYLRKSQRLQHLKVNTIVALPEPVNFLVAILDTGQSYKGHKQQVSPEKKLFTLTQCKK